MGWFCRDALGGRLRASPGLLGRYEVEGIELVSKAGSHGLL